MTSRVSRDPVGLASGQHDVREGDQTAALQYSNGDNVSSSLEDAADNRLPKVESFDSSLDVSTGSAGRTDQTSLRGTQRGVLPVLFESERSRAQEDEGSDDSLGEAGTSGDSGTGRREAVSQDGIETSSGSAEAGCQDSSGESEPGDGGLRQSEETASRCFLNRLRPCNQTCVAFTVGLRDPCRLIRAVERLAPDPRQNRPAPPAPKVGS